MLPRSDIAQWFMARPPSGWSEWGGIDSNPIDPPCDKWTVSHGLRITPQLASYLLHRHPLLSPAAHLGHLCPVTGMSSRNAFNDVEHVPGGNHEHSMASTVTASHAAIQCHENFMALSRQATSLRARCACLVA